jgi:ATP-dependent RNA helicase DDX18/HAS1
MKHSDMKNHNIVCACILIYFFLQVLNVCRAVSKGGAPFRSIILTGGFKWKTQVESLVQGAEIVVATPGRFLQHLQSGTLQLNNLKW